VHHFQLGGVTLNHLNHVTKFEVLSFTHSNNIIGPPKLKSDLHKPGNALLRGGLLSQG